MTFVFDLLSEMTKMPLYVTSIIKSGYQCTINLFDYISTLDLHILDLIIIWISFS